MNLAPRELPGDDYVWWRECALAFDCFANALLGGRLDGAVYFQVT
jgi:hypothetical protein